MSASITKATAAPMATWRYMGDNMDSAGRLATALCKTGLAPNGMTPGQAFYILLAGAEIGVRGPIEALRHIQVVKGKPTMSAELMRAFMLEAGCKIEWQRNDDTGAILKVTRPDGSSGVFSFLEADARRAGLLGTSGSGWSKYPAAMYAARATSIAARLFCPDMVRGATYTPEELGAAVTVTEDGGMEAAPVAAPPAVETHDPVTGEIHPVSGDDEPFPGVPMKPAAKPGDVLTDEQVDRFVVRMCELLGVDDSAGPVSAMIRIEDELRARRAPFSLGQVDKLTRSEARTIVQWAEAAAKQHTAVEVSEGPASATTGAVHQAAQGSGAVMAGRDRPGHASNLGQGPATVPASTATHSADAHVSNGADPGQSFPTATATAPPADHPLTDEQRARLDAAKERGRGKGRA